MLRKIMIVSILLLAQTAIYNISISSADELEKTEKVVVTGIGVDADKARQNAIRNAVEQVVGTYISSDTMVKDSALISDEILSYSSGYVKESRIISTDKDDYLIKIKLEALVVTTKLKRKIQALNITVKKVDGNSLFGEAFSKATTAKSGNEQLLKILSKYPQAAYHTEIGKPEILSVNHDTNQAKVKINLKLNFDNDFISEFEAILKAVSYKQLANLDISKWGYSENSISSKVENNDFVFMFTNSNLLSRSVVNRAYIVSVGMNLLNDNQRILHHLTRQFNSISPKVLIKLCDETNNVLDVIGIQLQDQLENYKQNSSFPPFISSNAPLILHSSYGYTVGTGRYEHILLAINKSINFKVEFEADISLLDKVTSIKASFEPFNMSE